ncbi:MAG: 2OG-Fe(II) oxygenase [Albidovulum sp.]
MQHIVDLDRYPLDRPKSAAFIRLVDACKAKLAQDGLFNLPDFLRPAAIALALGEVNPVLQNHAFTHARRHNIYFRKSIEGLDPSHRALREFETENRTICADQLGQAVVVQLYEWEPFIQFLAAVMGKPKLFVMEDPLARVNVMAYQDGQALNWHFDRSEFTTTLLLQAPLAGGEFEYQKDLRSDHDPNYDGVADLLEGQMTPVRMPLSPGTLNVFKGKNTAHRVTPVVGGRDRIIAVISYFERPGVCFSEEERIGFYGRAQ